MINDHVKVGRAEKWFMVFKKYLAVLHIMPNWCLMSLNLMYVYVLVVCDMNIALK